MFANASDFFNLYIQAGSLNASADCLAELAEHRDPRIRRRVAENPGTSPAILSMLGTDHHPDVRIAVGLNRSAPLSVVEKLVCDPDPSVRLGLAQELSTPVYLLEELKNDEHPYVSCQAKKTIELLQESESLGRIDAFSMRKSRRQRESTQRRRKA